MIPRRWSVVFNPAGKIIAKQVAVVSGQQQRAGSPGHKIADIGEDGIVDDDHPATASGGLFAAVHDALFQIH